MIRPACYLTETPEGAAGEGVTLDAEGNLYAAEETVGGLTKYIPRLVPRGTKTVGAAATGRP